MPINRLAASSVFRLAVLFAALYTLAIALTGAAVFMFATSELEHRMKLGIHAEQMRFRSIFERQGVEGLKAAVERHGGSIGAAEAVYALIGPDGRMIAGNTSPLQPFAGWKMVPDEGFKFLSPQSDDPDWFYLHGIELGNHVLITGRSNEDVEEPQEIVLKGVSWGAIATLLIGLGGAWIAGSRAQKRINAIQRTLELVSKGNLKARVETGGKDDDIARISGSINDALRQLESLVDGMKQISSDIAHDLKTPIGRVRQKLETARRTAKSVADYQQSVDETVAEIDAIVATFEALLRIAQIGGGASRARFKYVGLGEVLRTIEEAYAPVAEEAGDTLALDIWSGDGDVIKGDRNLLVQMFANLVENAIRHCPTGSHVLLELTMRAGKLVASVSDNGPGIPPEERDKVLRRFYRVDKSRSTPGNGLGLSLVSAIAKLHDAEIELKDAGPGLRVEVEFKPDHIAASGS
jgi:signal transduction histidine kinase